MLLAGVCLTPHSPDPLLLPVWDFLLRYPPTSFIKVPLFTGSFLFKQFVIFPFFKKREKVKSLSCVRLFATPWTVAHQAPPSMGFSRQEYWSGLLFPSPGDLPNPGIKPRSPTLQADSLTSEPPRKPLL